jgi:hypothetical protein
MRSGRTLTLLQDDFSTGSTVTSVAWSADDGQLAFVIGTGGSYQPNYDAWVVSSDGEHARRLGRYSEGSVDNVQWLPAHPDTLLIESDYSAYLVRANGTGKRDLPAVYDVYGASPDGKTVLDVDTKYDSAGNYYRSAISLANLRTGEIRQLTQRH